MIADTQVTRRTSASHLDPVSAMAGAEPRLWWGTNREGGLYYAGRVHVVWPGRKPVALCGLPVQDLWELRPSVPELVCPDCCVRAVAALFPVFPADTAHPPTRQPTRSRHELADHHDNHDLPMGADEHSGVLPTYPSSATTPVEDLDA